MLFIFHSPLFGMIFSRCHRVMVYFFHVWQKEFSFGPRTNFPKNSEPLSIAERMSEFPYSAPTSTFSPFKIWIQYLPRVFLKVFSIIWWIFRSIGTTFVNKLFVWKNWISYQHSIPMKFKILVSRFLKLHLLKIAISHRTSKGVSMQSCSPKIFTPPSTRNIPSHSPFY